MPATSYQIRVCQNVTCGLRYPLTENHPFGERCPACLGPTLVALTRSLDPEPAWPPNQPAMKLEALLDNVRSAWNVGAMFRTADGLGVGRLFLCGITPTPESKEVRKTALGAEESVAWEYARNALDVAAQLKQQGVVLWALEQDARAVAIGETDAGADVEADKRMQTASPAGNPGSGGRLVLVVGNEVTGVDPGLLDLCDRIVHIPMRGQKRSLNVEVAFGIAAHQILNRPG